MCTSKVSTLTAQPRTWKMKAKINGIASCFAYTDIGRGCWYFSVAFEGVQFNIKFTWKNKNRKKTAHGPNNHDDRLRQFGLNEKPLARTILMLIRLLFEQICSIWKINHFFGNEASMCWQQNVTNGETFEIINGKWIQTMAIAPEIRWHIFNINFHLTKCAADWFKIHACAVLLGIILWSKKYATQRKRNLKRRKNMAAHISVTAVMPSMCEH